MRPAVSSLEVGLPHLLVWIAVVAAVVTGYFVARWWRRLHPKTTPSETTYSQRLSRRFAEARKEGSPQPPTRVPGEPRARGRSTKDLLADAAPATRSAARRGASSRRAR